MNTLIFMICNCVLYTCFFGVYWSTNDKFTQAGKFFLMATILVMMQIMTAHYMIL